MGSETSHYYRVLPGGLVESAYGAGVKQARDEKLFSSATTVLSMVANPGLQIWIVNNLLESVLANPIQPMETNEVYISRIKEAADVKRLTAADFGGRLHDALEHYPIQPADMDILPYYDAVAPWIMDNVGTIVGNEVMLAHGGIGIAGKTDMIYYDKAGELCILDFKTTGFKKTKTGKWAKPSFYSSWARQLAFYAECYRIRHGLCKAPKIVSLAINSVEPSPPVHREWTEAEQADALREFFCAAYLYSQEKNHWPVGKWDILDSKFMLSMGEGLMEDPNQLVIHANLDHDA